MKFDKNNYGELVLTVIKLIDNSINVHLRKPIINYIWSTKHIKSMVRENECLRGPLNRRTDLIIIYRTYTGEDKVD